VPRRALAGEDACATLRIFSRIDLRGSEDFTSAAVTLAEFNSITQRYGRLRIAVLGDFCLDRYLEIDPVRREISIETNLPVHNVVNIRAQAGGAGTIVNNLAALGVGKIIPIGFRGDDAEGFELHRALSRLPGVVLDHLVPTSERRTFTYTKPLLLRRGKAPEELNRLDIKNWTPTPGGLRKRIARSLKAIAPKVDALIVLDQTDVPETGVITPEVLKVLSAVVRAHPRLLIVADSRRGLRAFPPVIFKMNAAELAASFHAKQKLTDAQVETHACALARENGQPVFVTRAERGILAALPDGELARVGALPIRGPIDIVGAGDAVMANLTSALAAKAIVAGALAIANAAASVVIHQLGTTGTASIAQLRKLVCGSASRP
jgi:rfaE bifunctional protein kinase chain/domain